MYGIDYKKRDEFNERWYLELKDISNQIYWDIDKNKKSKIKICWFDVPDFWFEDSLLIDHEEALVYTDPYGNDGYCQNNRISIYNAILNYNTMI